MRWLPSELVGAARRFVSRRKLHPRSRFPATLGVFPWPWICPRRVSWRLALAFRDLTLVCPVVSPSFVPTFAAPTMSLAPFTSNAVNLSPSATRDVAALSVPWGLPRTHVSTLKKTSTDRGYCELVRYLWHFLPRAGVSFSASLKGFDPVSTPYSPHLQPLQRSSMARVSCFPRARRDVKTGRLVRHEGSVVQFSSRWACCSRLIGAIVNPSWTYSRLSFPRKASRGNGVWLWISRLPRVLAWIMA